MFGHVRLHLLLGEHLFDRGSQISLKPHHLFFECRQRPGNLVIRKLLLDVFSVDLFLFRTGFNKRGKPFPNQLSCFFCLLWGDH